MKTKYIIFISIFIFILSLVCCHPYIDVLPKGYYLNKQESLIIFTHKVKVYKINKDIDISEIGDYPKSNELTETGYSVKEWHQFDSKKDILVINYLQDLVKSERNRNTHIVKKLIENLNNDDFLFSKIGLQFGYKNNKQISLSYFYFINIRTNTLFSFEVLPDM